MENSGHDFSGRELREDVKRLLSQFSDGIDKLVAFGSKMLDWDLAHEGVEKNDSYIVPILFLRNLVENIDAISILIRHGASEPCKSLLRTVLENLFSLEYLLAENEAQRCLCFLVWNTNHNQKFYDKLDGASQQAKHLNTILRKDKLLKDGSSIIFDGVDKLKANAKDLLNLDLYKEVAAELEKTKQNLKNPNWYSMFGGPQNVEALASSSKLSGLYEIYRILSNSVHGVDVIQGKLISLGPGQIGIPQFRFPNDAQLVTQHAHSLCISAYNVYINKRLSHKATDYNAWYESIRDFHLALSKNKYINVEL